MSEAVRLAPRIEIFTPFKQPFSERSAEAPVVAPSVVEYMKAENSKIVAKCTPCQCCACR
jgi:hypothetical protein